MLKKPFFWLTVIPLLMALVAYWFSKAEVSALSRYGLPIVAFMVTGIIVSQIMEAFGIEIFPNTSDQY